MAKISDDRYYTPRWLAKRLIDATMRVLSERGFTVDDVVEPSAGDGAFSGQIECTAYDISPACEGIIKADFLTEPIEYRKNRLCIGNPPFGRSNCQSVRFFKKCCQIGDYIAFIQPISQLDNNLQMYDFDLVYSEDLGNTSYSGKKLHCCFNIYIRPKDGKLNPKPDYRLRDVGLVELRRGIDKEIPEGYDFAICTWGNVGSISSFKGQFALEVYVYVHKKEYLPAIKELLNRKNIAKYAQSTTNTGMYISRMRICKYLKDNIEGIE